MSRPVAPDLDDNPRIPASWSREDLARELRKERRRCAEEITESRKLKAALEPLAAIAQIYDERVYPPDSDSQLVSVCLGDLRKALAALTQATAKP